MLSVGIVGQAAAKKAVELSAVRGKIKQVAEELGIEAHLIYHWKKEFSKYDF